MPTYNEAELAIIASQNAVLDATKLDPDEEDALAEATVNDLMTLADILDENPQMFINEAYADPLKYYPPDPPNTTDFQDAKNKIISNNKDTKVVSILSTLSTKNVSRKGYYIYIYIYSNILCNINVLTSILRM